MKKTLVILLLLTLCAWSLGAGAATATQAPSQSAGPAAQPAASADQSAVPADQQLKPAAPYIITTCGQSPGAVMVSMAAMQSGIKAVYNNKLTAEELDTKEYKTLIITSGTSMKGMGAAGTDVNTEIARCKKLAEAAKAAGMLVIGAHIEGMARRTDSSDSASIDAVMQVADIVLVVEESDSDGFFTKYAQENNKPLLKVKDALGIGEVLK